MEISAETNAGGRFRFDTLAPAVVFRKDGFESQLARVPSQPTELRIVLKIAPMMEAVPICLADSNCVSVSTGIFCLPKVAGIEIGNPGGSIDAFERLFSVHTASGHWQMIHGTGPSWGGATPRYREVWSSITYHESIRKGDRIQAMDATGKTLDGKRWRHIGVAGESVFYFDLDAEAAAIMDRMLDGLCLNRK
jgi:hypothetical protein